MPKTIGLFPAGKYYVGDLCYVIKDWDAVCDLILVGHKCLNGEFPWKGKSFWLHGTAFGDGVYYDQYENQYGVDAGLIGVLPVDLVDKIEHVREMNELGHIHDFNCPFTCEYYNGTFHICDVTIETDSSYDYDD